MDVIEFRNSVIESAIRGELTKGMVEHSEDSHGLISQITDDKRLFFLENKINKKINIKSLELTDPPYSIPKNWIWLKVEDVTNIGYFKSVTSDEVPKESWVLELKDVEKDTGKLLNIVAGEDLDIKSDKVTVKKGDVLYSKLRPYLKKILVAPLSGYATTEMFPLTVFGGILPEYIALYLKSNTFLSIVESGSKGDMPRTNATKLKSYPIALPPIKEQKHIIKIVNKLIVFSELVEKRQKLDKRFKMALKSSILHMAIRGKLVPQFPEEEPILSKLRSLNIAHDQIDDGPYELPKGWIWAKLETISEKLSAGGDKPREVSSARSDEFPIPIYANGVTENGLYGFCKEAKITVPSLTVSARGTIGFSVIRREPYTPIVRLISITPNQEIIYLKYLKVVFDASYTAGNGTSIPQLTVPQVKGKLIPVPPLQEQKRIVTVYEKLISNLL